MLEGGGLVIRYRVHNGYDIPSPARKIVKAMRGAGSPPGTGDGRTLITMNSDIRQRTLLLTMRDPFGTVMGTATIDVTGCLGDDTALHLPQILQWCGRYVQSDPSNNPMAPSYIDVSEAE